MRRYGRLAAACIVLAGAISFGPTRKAHAGSSSGTCLIGLVQADLVNDNVVVTCGGGSSINGIQYFSYPVSANAPMAQALMNLEAGMGMSCNAAELANPNNVGTHCTVAITYDDSGADNPPGCGMANCRRLQYLSAL